MTSRSLHLVLESNDYVSMVKYFVSKVLSLPTNPFLQCLPLPTSSPKLSYWCSTVINYFEFSLL